MGNRVHSGPASGRQGGLHSTIVTCRGATSHSTRIWSRRCAGTRCSHQRRTCATSSSGNPVSATRRVSQNADAPGDQALSLVRPVLENQLEASAAVPSVVAHADHRRLPQPAVPLVRTVATLADIAAGTHSIDAERVAARRHGHKSDRPVGNDRMLSSRHGRPARCNDVGHAGGRRPLDLHPWPPSSPAIASSWEIAPGRPAATHSR
jgi:hypothetical protein